MAKLKVKVFSGPPDDIEKAINDWMVSYVDTITIIKFHQPTHTEGSRLAVLVEYSEERRSR